MPSKKHLFRTLKPKYEFEPNPKNTISGLIQQLEH